MLDDGDAEVAEAAAKLLARGLVPPPAAADVVEELEIIGEVRG